MQELEGCLDTLFVEVVSIVLENNSSKLEKKLVKDYKT